MRLYSVIFTNADLDKFKNTAFKSPCMKNVVIWQFLKKVSVSSCTKIYFSTELQIRVIIIIIFFYGWAFRVGTWNVESLTGRSGELVEALGVGAFLQATSRVPRWWIGERPPDMAASCDIYK